MPRSRLLLGSLALAAGLVAAQPDPPPVPRAALKGRVAGRAATTVTADPPMSDDEALKAAGLSPTDGPQLVAYLKLRSSSDNDQGKIQGLIRKLGVDSFEDRLKAGEDLELFGPAALSPLKAVVAQKDADPEIAYQAGRVLKRLERAPHSA